MGGADPQQDPRELTCPVGPGEPGGERRFQLAVKPLYHPIGLGVVGGCLSELDAQELGDVGPELGHEMRPTVRDDDGRSPKAGDPGGDERPCHALGGRVRHGDGFGPPGEPVHDREQVCVALQGWEGTHEVRMNRLESAVRCWDPVNPGVGVAVHLRPLAGHARPCPSGDITVEPVPNVTAGHQSYRCPGSGVS